MKIKTIIKIIIRIKLEKILLIRKLRVRKILINKVLIRKILVRRLRVNRVLIRRLGIYGIKRYIKVKRLLIILRITAKFIYIRGVIKDTYTKNYI